MWGILSVASMALFAMSFIHDVALNLSILPIGIPILLDNAFLLALSLSITTFFLDFAIDFKRIVKKYFSIKRISGKQRKFMWRLARRQGRLHQRCCSPRASVTQAWSWDCHVICCEVISHACLAQN